jgi:2-C-methyl-D-erythritol 4-phosphate cytidylyltransferase
MNTVQRQYDGAGLWVVVPAAGIGSRMQTDRPKQYLPLAGQTVLEHTLKQLLNHPQVKGVVLSLAAEDHYWQDLPTLNDPRIITVVGGEQRCHSVLNGLLALTERIDVADWVLVHDVARPCLSYVELDSLLSAALYTNHDGCVLGLPVRDTMKQTSAKGVVELTPDRACLWHAFTPQMFRLAQLIAALEQCLAKELLVTDEASAMEQCGYTVQMVAGSANNIKITRPEDLPLAEFILAMAGK